MKTFSLRLYIDLRHSSNVFKIFITYLVNRSSQGLRATVSACHHINNILCVVTNNQKRKLFTSCWFQTKCNSGAKGYDKSWILLYRVDETRQFCESLYKGFQENITSVSKSLGLSQTDFQRPTSYPGKILFRAALASLFTLLSLARSLGRSSLGKN